MLLRSQVTDIFHTSCNSISHVNPKSRTSLTFSLCRMIGLVFDSDFDDGNRLLAICTYIIFTFHNTCKLVAGFIHLDRP